jgi:hypothetical protein
MKFKRWAGNLLVGLASVASPLVVLPKNEERAAPATEKTTEYEKDAVYDDEYAGEVFYRGLPVFNREGERTWLEAGAMYVEGQITLGNGEPLMCWRDSRWKGPKCTKLGERGNDPTIFAKGVTP